MSATHRVQVLARKDATVTVEIVIAHEDVHSITLRKTALLSMLFESLSSAEDEVSDAVREAYEEAGGDEPLDAREAGKVIRSVSGIEVLAGKVKHQTATSIDFAGGGRVRVVLLLRKPALAEHLEPGLTWETAPLHEDM